MAQFSESDVSRAREMDLLTYLKFYEPYELKRVSRKVYSTRTHDSLKISNGWWMWWSRGIGGRSALDYLIKVKGMKFPDAVGLILGTQTVIPKEVYHKAKPPPKKFSLPKKAENNDKAVSYLMSRGISEEVINFFIDKGMLYQSSYRNKTKSGERIIPMLSDVREALKQEYMSQLEEGFNESEVDGYTGFIFKSRYNTVLAPHSVNTAIARIIKACNAKEIEDARSEGRTPELLPHFSCHNLRHTFCTRFCENETNLKVIQEIMGHADITTTMDVYNEATKDKKMETFAGLEGKIKIR